MLHLQADLSQITQIVTLWTMRYLGSRLILNVRDSYEENEDHGGRERSVVLARARTVLSTLRFAPVVPSTNLSVSQSA